MQRRDLDLALADIVDAVYPGGNPAAEWSADTIEAVASVLRAFELAP